MNNKFMNMAEIDVWNIDILFLPASGYYIAKS